jgi:hypothetical protein
MLAPPDRARPRTPPPLDRVRPKLFFQWEPFSRIAREIAPLFNEHWRELALNQDNIALDPDFDRYLACELAGILHVLCARDSRAGRLVGYVFAMLGPHLHYVSTSWCIMDMYWLRPEYRTGWNGVRMFKAFERGAIERGAKIIMGTEKLHFAGKHKHGRNAGSLFTFLGYDPIETVFSKRVG